MARPPLPHPRKSSKQGHVEMQTDFHPPFFKFPLVYKLYCAIVKMATSTERELNISCCSKDQASSTPQHQCGSAADASTETEESAGGISFNPPLYIQRYNLVTEFVRRTNARKVPPRLGCVISFELELSLSKQIYPCSAATLIKLCLAYVYVLQTEFKRYLPSYIHS